MWRPNVKLYLQNEPQARKLENRPIAVWNILKTYQNPNLETMDKQSFIKYWYALQTIDRNIRDLQAEFPELTDTENEIHKQEMELQTVKSLGY